jgi:hypothetical protein
MTAAIYVSLLLMFGVALLAGGTSDAVYLRYPQVGNKAHCGPYDEKGMTAEMGARKRDRCIQDYQLQGYERVKEFGATPAVVR